MRPLSPRAALLAASLLLSVQASAQGVRALTPANPNRQPGTATISPNGVWVLYSDVGGPRLISFDGNTEFAWPIANFVCWSPASDAVFSFDYPGTAVQRVSVPALAVSTVAQVTGLHVLLGIDNAGANLFGVRLSAPGTYTAFRLAIATGLVTDLHSHVALQFARAVDPAGTVMLAKVSTQPLVEQVLAISLASGTSTVLAQHVAIDAIGFADGYRGVLCEYYDPFLASGQRDLVFAPLDRSSPPRVISSANSPIGLDPAAVSVVAGGWAPSSAYVPVVTGTRGGGEVCLDAERSLLLTSASISNNGRVAFSAAELTTTMDPVRLYVAELDRELVAAPEILGGTAQIDLPLRAGEAGAIVMSLSAAMPLVVPGFTGRLFLSGSPFVLASGVGNGTNPLSVSFPIPNDLALEGYPLYLQGARVDPNLNRNELTRLMVFSVPLPR